MSTEVEDKKIVSENYILILRKLNVFDEFGNKASMGKPYLLIQTTRGNISLKGVAEFVKAVCAFFKRDFNKVSTKLINKEFILTRKNRIEFNDEGVKSPSGLPYLWIQTTKLGISIDWADMGSFCKNLVEMLK